MYSSDKRSTRKRALTRRRILLEAAALGTACATVGGFGTFVVRRALAGQTAASHDTMAAHAINGGTVPRAPFDPNAPLAEPEIRRSVDGALRTNLRVTYAYKDIGGYRLFLRTYEGDLPGPTLRVRPGDTIHIRLVNDLPPNRDPVPVDMALPHQFNTTNFHFHGMHVSPAGIADNIFRVMEPGHAYDIEVSIPQDHPRGTFWYHPHNHGSADIQITSGMAGTVVVEGDFDQTPEIAAAADRVLILNEVLFDHRGMIEAYDTVWPEAAPRFLSVNGQREPTIRMRPGEVQRWRIVDACHENNLLLALDRHDLHAIAYDGIRLPSIDSAASLPMAPGQRADVLVQAGAPGAYLLKAVANDQGYPSPVGTLAKVVIEGEPLPMRLPAALPPAALATIRDEEITNRREIILTVDQPEFPPAAEYQEFAYLICGHRFDPDRVDHRIPLGAVEEWTVINADTSDHVFHVHTNHFQMVAVNGQKLADPVWRDSVVVPRNGRVTVRSRFLDYTGRFVLHCHMMNHEELGMMQIIEVYAA